MQAADLVRLIGLSAIWGASFLFMRIAAPAFGPISLMMIRVGVALLCFVPFFLRAEVRASLRENSKHLFVIGMLSTVFPFCLLGFATLSLEAGFTSLVNAATPLFAAMVGAVDEKGGSSVTEPRRSANDQRPQRSATMAPTDLDEVRQLRTETEGDSVLEEGLRTQVLALLDGAIKLLETAADNRAAAAGFERDRKGIDREVARLRTDLEKPERIPL